MFPHGINECLKFLEVPLGMYLVVGEYWSEIVEDVEVFDVLIVGMDFLDRNAEDGGRFWLESQLLHLREAVDAL